MKWYIKLKNLFKKINTLNLWTPLITNFCFQLLMRMMVSLKRIKEISDERHERDVEIDEDEADTSGMSECESSDGEDINVELYKGARIPSMVM